MCVCVCVCVCVCTHAHTRMHKCLVAQSCPTLCDPMDCSPPGSSVHRDFPGKNTEVGRLSILQGIFPTQESNQGLLHCRWVLYQLSYQGSPYTYIHIHLFFNILFHYGLLQDTEYSSLCYTVGPCCLPILYMVVCFC